MTDETNLDQDARDAIAHRVSQLHGNFTRRDNLRADEEDKSLTDEERADRKAKRESQSNQIGEEIYAKAVSVYEDAIKRRGAHQAALDQLQGGIGLPLEAAKRQAEIERRERENGAASLAVSGQGTMQSNLEGTTITAQDQRPDVNFGDGHGAAFNANVPDGQGAKIEAQVIAVEQMQRENPGAALTPENLAKSAAGEKVETETKPEARERVDEQRFEEKKGVIEQRPDLNFGNQSPAPGAPLLDPDGNAPSGTNPGDPNPQDSLPREGESEADMIARKNREQEERELADQHHEG